MQTCSSNPSVGLSIHSCACLTPSSPKREELSLNTRYTHEFREVGNGMSMTHPSTCCHVAACHQKQNCDCSELHISCAENVHNQRAAIGRCNWAMHISSPIIYQLTQSQIVRCAINLIDPNVVESEARKGMSTTSAAVGSCHGARDQLSLI